MLALLPKPDGCQQCGAPNPRILLTAPIVRKPEWLCRTCFVLHPTSADFRDAEMERVREATLEGLDEDACQQTCAETDLAHVTQSRTTGEGK
jgi:hypothetical protein